MIDNQFIRREKRTAMIAFSKAKTLIERKKAQSDLRYWTLRDTKTLTKFVKDMQNGSV